MNKQQLAAKIWESANKMRSKIEANEYKDYILGFIFYKFLSEREVEYLKSIEWTEEYLPKVTEEDQEIVENVQKNLGYFISYENLFSTWIKKGKDFSVQDVRDALSAFQRLINPTHRKVFEGIFETLHTGLSKLGDSATSQSKAISELLYLIKDIPMDDKQEYDVLGFIYEYLIEKFAANAGKKAGEFYTPYEVSLLMSKIVSEHLKDREQIEIYDPTSGSSSLLINIGKCASKYINGKDKIKYYAQELKQNTYNLTRMNLVMRGIKADNIVTRNGDTLEDDWPYFDDKNKENTYEVLYVDAVVSNPPYSQPWNPEDKDSDARYAGYGLAPKSKADYAFLLHDLYHLKPDGIMNIVLPHGVLFRGGEEGEIRKNLIEKNKIDAIIGLPSNIFYGTGIPTIIMVLKQKRTDTDILFIDASKGFIKEGKNNKLRASDIKKILDTVVERKSVEKFSRVVSRDEIRANDYNLNIPRYVDSSEDSQTWDIYSLMFGGVSVNEINVMNKYWKVFPKLREELFKNVSSEHYEVSTNDVKKFIKEHEDTLKFKNHYNEMFSDFDKYLYSELIEDIYGDFNSKESKIAENIFERLSTIPLVDKYEAYQLLDDEWSNISNDVEIIQTEGFESTKIVDANMVIKKSKNEEVQDGWKGRILSFELVQNKYLHDELNALNTMESRLSDIVSEYSELLKQVSEDDNDVLNEDNTSFVEKEVTNELNRIMQDISTPETKVLDEYLSLSSISEKNYFIKNHPEINWSMMSQSKNGTYTNKEVNNYVAVLKSNIVFEEGTYEYILNKVSSLTTEEKQLKKDIKEHVAKLQPKTKEIIEGLTDDEVKRLLKDKWISPIVNSIMSLPNKVINDLSSSIDELYKKYETTFEDVEKDIRETEKELLSMIGELEGNELDMLGLVEFRKLLGGE